MLWIRSVEGYQTRRETYSVPLIFHRFFLVSIRVCDVNSLLVRQFLQTFNISGRYELKPRLSKTFPLNGMTFFYRPDHDVSYGILHLFQ